MLLLSVLFGLLSMLGFAFANVTSQPLARKFGSTQVILLRTATTAAVLFMLSIPSLHNLKDVNYVIFTFLLGVVGYIPVLAFTHGVKISRVSIVSPIAGTSPLITVLLAFIILNTPLKSLTWFAIILIVLANVAASINPKSLKDSNILKLASGVPFGLIAAMGWGTFFFALVYSTRALGPWLAIFLAELGVATTAGIHLLLSKQKVEFKQALNPKIIGNGLAIVIGGVAFAVGVSHYNVGIVAALSNSVALPSILLAAYLFKERLNLFEKLTSAIMILGVVILSLG